MVPAGREDGREPCPAGAPSPESAFRPDGAHRFSPTAPAIVALTSWKLPDPHWFVRVPRPGIANFRSTRPFPVGFAGVPIVRRIDWPTLLARDAAGFVAVNISMAIIAWPGAAPPHAMDCRLGRRGERVKRRRRTAEPAKQGLAGQTRRRALSDEVFFWVCRTDGAKGGQAWKSATRSFSFASRASFSSRSFMSLSSLRASSSSTILPYSSNSSTVS